MVVKSLFEKVFGRNKGLTHFKYLKNKHQGGINNAKGNVYENFFAVYQIAKLFNQNSSERTLLTAQSFSFVDDLEIEYNSSENFKRRRYKKTIKFFQTKDVGNLDWHSGEHPLETDFELQFIMAKKNGFNPKLNMVVSRAELSKKLNLTMPRKIKKYTRVGNFKSAASINSLIRINPYVKDELMEMCAISNPSSDKLDTLGNIILGAWDGTDKTKIKLGDIIATCYNLNPNYLKGFSERISTQLKEILDSIIGFTYKVENGYIVWSYGKTDSGTISFPIGSRDFLQWENDLFNLPRTQLFEGIESYLN